MYNLNHKPLGIYFDIFLLHHLFWLMWSVQLLCNLHESIEQCQLCVSELISARLHAIELTVLWITSVISHYNKAASFKRPPSPRNKPWHYTCMHWYRISGEWLEHLQWVKNVGMLYTEHWVGALVSPYCFFNEALLYKPLAHC